MANELILPGDTNRTTIVGKTGSGKTMAGLWHLSKQNFDFMPWVIIDFKQDDHIGLIKRAKYKSLDEKIPRRAGIYIYQPDREDVESGRLDEFFERIRQQGDIGIWVDEGFMVGDSYAYETILTQGRSKHIPIMTLTQRPVWLSRFVFSEAEFFQVFYLTDRRDIKTVQNFVRPRYGSEIDVDELPQYHSYYFDVSQGRLLKLSPVPKREKILSDIDEKLKSMKGKRFAL